MSDYEISESLQLRQQRFDAALKFTLHYMTHDDEKFADYQGMGDMMDEAIADADTLIAKLEAPNR